MPASHGPSFRKARSSRHLPALKASPRNANLPIGDLRHANREIGVPGVFPRAGMLRALGGTTWPCFQLEKTEGVICPAMTASFEDCRYKASYFH
jgi:hypothetical protein